MAEQLQVAIRAVNEATAALKAISGDIENVGNKAKESGEKAGGFGEKLKSMLEIGGGVAAGLGLAGAIGGVAESIRGAVEEADEYSKIQAQTDTVTKNLGGTTGVTAEQIRALAESFSKTTPYSKEMVQSAENMFASFSNISSKTLPEATQAALDVTAGMKAAGRSMDMGQITASLGRALQDPAKGMTALSREGIVFTKQQQEVVKQMEASGNVAGAQKYILDALEKSYGGAAKAAGDTLGGKIDILKNNWHDMTMTLVTDVMPAAVQLTTWIVSVALPAFTNLSEFVAEKVVPALVHIAQSDVAPVFERIGRAIQDSEPFLKSLADDAGNLMHWLGGFGPVAAAVAGFAAAIVVIPALIDAWAAAQKVLNTVQAIFDAEAEANPIGLIVTAIAALVAGIILLVMNWKKLEERFPILKTLTDDVRTGLEAFGAFLSGTFIPDLQAVVSFISDHWGTIKGIVTGIFDGVKQYLQGVWTEITSVIQGAWLVIKGIFDIIDGLLHGDWSQAWRGLQEVISGVWTTITGVVSGAVEALGGLLNAATGGNLGTIIDGVKGAFQGVADTVSSVFGGIGSVVKSGLNDVIGAINSFIGVIDAIKIHIPSIGVGPVHTPSFDWGGLNIPTIPYLAEGGIVTQPTLAVLGEAGPEAIIPLKAIGATILQAIANSASTGALAVLAGNAYQAIASSGAAAMSVVQNNPFLNPNGSANYSAIWPVAPPGTPINYSGTAPGSSTPLFYDPTQTAGVGYRGFGAVPVTRGGQPTPGSIAPVVNMTFNGPTTSKELVAAMDNWLKGQLGFGAVQHGVV